MRKIIIIGATSAIAQSVSRIYAKQHCHLYLLARNAERLQLIAQDLKIRGASAVEFASLDANHHFDNHQKIIDTAITTLGGIDIAIIAHGSLGDQKACESNVDLMLKEFKVNALSVMSLLTALANRFEAQKHGTIAVISSVAGDRGRQSNYVYGAAKGAVSIFLQGLRQRLYKSGVHVVTIKPGFVDSPMTAEFKKSLLWASPDTVAKDIVSAISKRKNVLYTPWFWRIIMFFVKSLPECLFKRAQF